MQNIIALLFTLCCIAISFVMAAGTYKCPARTDPKEVMYFTYVKDCRMYYDCTTGVAEKKMCPNGVFFDSRTRSCVNFLKADCSNLTRGCWFGKKMLLIFNGGTGEVAKIATPFKLFAIKRHLDDFLSSARYLDESDVTEVKLPIVPIMCVAGYLHGLHSNTTPTESDLTSLIKSILLNTLAVI
ncbi:hypothetical protein INT48_009663 [Thamnidium elegans]|uniref:Chitin-binding type-2 domain-containing protein n=1 Tax=Thamnidium elegans TaxID=101142 RepID=A0A8H7VY85_9FUNG|nr:hypothetical protein INT48_009663 [Thamnidium elegans]